MDLVEEGDEAFVRVLLGGGGEVGEELVDCVEE